jgi:hypothetical protein
LRDFQEAWQQHGREAVERLAKRDSRSFVYAALALVPKEMISEEPRRVYIIRDTPLSVQEWAEKHCGNVPIPEPDEPTH